MSSKILSAAVVIVLVVIAVLTFTWFNNFPGVNKKSWQAVFLNNNQVYFGHIKNVNRGYIALRDIYYLQTTQALQQGASAQPVPSLVKLGSELHGPEDLMYIPKNNILFWENMKNDSQVVQAIQGALQRAITQ
ncbi:MAG: hypothetical protein AAB967_00165 [Patescibacteria group bacterium]